MILATTVAITQEIGRNGKYLVIISAIIKVKWASTIVSTISTSSLFFIYPITFENNTQVKIQKIIPPNNIEINSHHHWIYVIPETTPHSRIIHKITTKRATEVPSLNKLSHSKSMVSLLGAQTFLKVAKTATGSVAEINAQNKKHTKKGICNQTSGSIK